MVGCCCPHCGDLRGFLTGTVDDLEVTVRVWNCLKKAGLRWQRDIAVMPDRELLKVKNFGRVSLAELRALVPYREDQAAWRALQPSLAYGAGRIVGRLGEQTR